MRNEWKRIEWSREEGKRKGAGERWRREGKEIKENWKKKKKNVKYAKRFYPRIDVACCIRRPLIGRNKSSMKWTKEREPCRWFYHETGPRLLDDAATSTVRQSACSDVLSIMVLLPRCLSLLVAYHPTA